MGIAASPTPAPVNHPASTMAVVRRKRSRLAGQLPSRRDWAEILSVGVVAGGTGASLATLIVLGFDRNNVFAFFGAIVGAGMAVALTLANDGRAEKLRVKQDRLSVQSVLNASGMLLDEARAKFFDDESTVGDRYVACNNTAMLTRGLAEQLVEALAVISTLSFPARVAIRQAINDLYDVERLAAETKVIAEDGPVDYSELRRRMVGLANALAIARSYLKLPL